MSRLILLRHSVSVSGYINKIKNNFKGDIMLFSQQVNIVFEFQKTCFWGCWNSF
jgi:hypothetical protein